MAPPLVFLAELLIKIELEVMQSLASQQIPPLWTIALFLIKIELVKVPLLPFQ